jgi:phospholipid/cholesterol/gamma-HCH transport system substrate-binding protein
MIGRIAAVAAIVIAVGVVAIVLVGSGSTDFTVRAQFQNASQLVKGNLVQVAGDRVGDVTDINLTRDGQAEITMRITDPDYAPLRKGTEATVRQASLSGVANRYVDLRLPPETKSSADMRDGDVIPATETTTAVDLDQLFNTFDPQARKALQGVIRGFATQYGGRGEEANKGFLYLNPALASSSRLFEELNRDTPLLKRFIVSSSKLVTDVADRRDDLAGLVDNLADTTGAIARQKSSLSSALQQLPPFMRRANSTFVNLRATLDDLDPLVADSKPVAKKLRPFLAALRPFARDARPTVRDLSRLIRSPGASNDLIEATRALVPLRDVTVRDVQANGKQREGAFPATTKALSKSIPEIAFARPYAVDLTGWFDDFSTSGDADANGAASRAPPHVNAFAAATGQQTAVDGIIKLLPIPPQLQQAVFEQTATTGFYNRCPGSMERGEAYKPTPDFNCDLNQVPTGK